MKFKKWFLKIKNHIRTVLTIKETPKSIAAGFTLGTILAILPTFGLGALFGLALLLIFKKMSKISMLAAFGVWNPAVLFPIYSASYFIGNLLIGNVVFKSNFNFIVNKKLYIYSIKFLLGNFILAILFSVIAYIIIYKIAAKYQKQYKNYIANPLEKNIMEPIENLV